MYTRYEIKTKDKSMGLFTGLYETLNEKLADELIEPFNKYLSIPDFYYLKGKNGKKNIYAYFTEDGLLRFKKEIEKILEVTTRENINVIIKKQNAVGTARLIYKDKYQALIKSK